MLGYEQSTCMLDILCYAPASESHAEPWGVDIGVVDTLVVAELDLL